MFLIFYILFGRGFTPRLLNLFDSSLKSAFNRRLFQLSCCPPGNIYFLNSFKRAASRHWLKALQRRIQKHNMNWEKYGKLSDLCILDLSTFMATLINALMLNTLHKSRIQEICMYESCAGDARENNPYRDLPFETSNSNVRYRLAQITFRRIKTSSRSLHMVHASLKLTHYLQGGSIFQTCLNLF